MHQWTRVLAAAVLLSIAAGIGEARDSSRRRGSGSTRTVIPGTWVWTIESNRLGETGNSDLWWCHSDERRRCLAPRHGAELAIVKHCPFEDITPAFLKEDVVYTPGPVSGSDARDELKVGTVLAVRTGKGGYAKLKVLRYYSMHDFSYPGSEIVPKEWRALAPTLPNVANYSMEVEWVYYPAR